jgi:hypothetical protein
MWGTRSDKEIAESSQLIYAQQRNFTPLTREVSAERVGGMSVQTAILRRPIRRRCLATSWEPNIAVMDLAKLTVPQLKILCKERNLTGYSKLNKTALLQKLAEAGGSSAPATHVLAASSANSGQADTASATHISTPASGQSTTKAHTPVPAGNSRSVPDTVSTALSQHPQTVSSSDDALSSLKRTSDGTADQPLTKKRILSSQLTPASFEGSIAGPVPSEHVFKVPAVPTQRSSTKPSAVIVSSSSTARPTKVSPAITPRLSTSASSSVSTTEPLPAIEVQSSKPKTNPNLVSTLASGAYTQAPVDNQFLLSVRNALQPNNQSPESLLPRTSRFKPLALTKAITPVATHFSKPNILPSPATPPCLYYLDFPPGGPSPVLSPITLPPPRSQRKLVESMSIILRGLSDAERRNCVLASRMLRYSGQSNPAIFC